MSRVWIGTALLAASWLFGLGLYGPPEWYAWITLLLVGTFLLGHARVRMPATQQCVLAAALLVFPVWFFPWPYRAAPLWMLAGLAIQLVPGPRSGLKRFGRGAVTAGGLLLVQSTVMWLYVSLSAWSHDLPMPLVWTLAGVVRLLGIDAAVDGAQVVLSSSLGEVHRLAATWDLLLDPGSVAFLAAGLVILALMAWSRLPWGTQILAWLTQTGSLLVAAAVWLPIRAGLLTAVYLHRELTAAPGETQCIMNHFFSPWVHLALLGGLALLACRFVRLPLGSGEAPAPTPQPAADAGQGFRPFLIGTALVLVGTAVAAVGLFWEPPGVAKTGRVLVIERHTHSERTDHPYDTKTYGAAGSYTYAAMYAYCQQYFDMQRLMDNEPIDASSLAHCDVLIIKLPTESYSEDEVRAVVQFVKDGGGVLLIGDHTNLDKTSTNLNDIARRFGFAFRHDLLFGTPWPSQDRFVAPAVPHPILQHVPAFDFAVSCSIDPGSSPGKAAVRGLGLWSLPADYNMENSFPYPHPRPEMRAGAFVQLWAGHYGNGRAAGFADSTVFSNFCVFEPGKADLMIGMLNWLNHRSLAGDPRHPLTLVCALGVIFGLVLARRQSDGWLALMSAALCGFALAAATVAALPGFLAMSPPVRKQRMTQVTIDRTLSDVALSSMGYASRDGQGFALLEQWIPRLGYFTVRREGDAAFDGDALLVIAPTRPVSNAYRQRLVQYVEGGGRLIVLDSPENHASTTAENRASPANDLLAPFGLKIVYDQVWKGTLTLPDGRGGTPIEQACEVTGGEPLASLGGQRVIAARARAGKGSVMVLGFGSLFNDHNMGEDWENEPNVATLDRYHLLFALLRTGVTDAPLKLEVLLSPPVPSEKAAPKGSRPRL